VARGPYLVAGAQFDHVTHDEIVHRHLLAAQRVRSLDYKALSIKRERETLN